MLFICFVQTSKLLLQITDALPKSFNVITLSVFMKEQSAMVKITALMVVMNTRTAHVRSIHNYALVNR